MGGKTTRVREQSVKNCREQGAGSRGINLGSKEQQKKSREQRKIIREQPKKTRGSRETVKII